MPYVYILYSKSKDKYYVGISSTSPDIRLLKHNNHYYNNKFTHMADDWVIFFSHYVNNMTMSLRIERHIKNMKSRTYYHNLLKYPEIFTKLIQKYIDS